MSYKNTPQKIALQQAFHGNIEPLKELIFPPPYPQHPDFINIGIVNGKCILQTKKGERELKSVKEVASLMVSKEIPLLREYHDVMQWIADKINNGDG